MSTVQPVAAYSQDFTVGAGTLGRAHAQKIVRLMRYALKNGVPIVSMHDSGGARIQEAVDALSGYGDVFYNNVLASGVVPQIALVLGPCAGGRGLFAGADRLHHHDAPQRAHVHHRARDHPLGDRAHDDDGRVRQRRDARQRSAATCTSSPRTTATRCGWPSSCCRYLPQNNTEDPPHRLYGRFAAGPRRGDERPGAARAQRADGRAQDHRAAGRWRRAA